MAICKYGPLVSEVRGSIGGTTFTAGRFGNVVRQRRAPIHAPTPRRETYKSIFATVIGHWQHTLNQAQRDAWDTLGDNTNFTNSLGETFHPSGINLYVRTNVLLLKINQTRQDTAPAAAIGTHCTVSYSWVDDVAIKARREEIPGTGHHIAFWLSLPQNPSVKFYVGPWIKLAYEHTDDLAAYTNIFDHSLIVRDMRYFIRDRGIYAAGEITADYIQTLLTPKA